MQQLNISGVRSLCWSGDHLVDWVGGGRVLHLDRTITDPSVRYSYCFDSAVMSPCGDFAVIYERRGTKGLVLQQGRILREINRSCYHADVYEYPIAIFNTSEGRAVLVHCPEEYCRLEMEDIQTSERLTGATDRSPSDFFHSRLRVSPDGASLLSAGWIWHPWNDVTVFNIEAALRNPATLDRSLPIPKVNNEIVAAEFISSSRILIATSGESLDDEELAKPLLAVLDISSGQVRSSVQIDEPAGALMAIDDEFAVGFYGSPKLFSLKTGEVLHRWDEISSGNQTSSIILDDEHIPPIAIDRTHRRFAVAGPQSVAIVNVDSCL